MSKKWTLNLITSLGLVLLLTAYQSLAIAIPYCQSLLLPAPKDLPSEEIQATIANLAKMRLDIDTQKLQESSWINEDLEGHYQILFSGLLQNPAARLSEIEIKTRISAEIARLQSRIASAKQVENQDRDIQRALLSKPIKTRPTLEQLELQSKKAKAIFERYDEAAIKVPLLTALRAQLKTIPDNAVISEGTISLYDKFLIKLSQKYSGSFARIELFDSQNNLVGQSMTHLLNAPLLFIRTALSMSMGEAWSGGDFFEIHKVRITLTRESTGSEQMKAAEIKYFSEIKRLMEVLEFPNVSVEGSVLLLNSAKTTKRDILIPAKASALTGSYQTSWNTFHQGNNRYGEFDGPRVYGQRIYEGQIQEHEYAITQPHRRDYEEFLIDHGL